jgi:hypothetical protein
MSRPHSPLTLRRSPNGYGTLKALSDDELNGVEQKGQARISSIALR